MMDKEINIEDLELILESLRYTKLRFEEYDQYPSYEFKQKRIMNVVSVITKVEKLKRTFHEF